MDHRRRALFDPATRGRRGAAPPPLLLLEPGLANALERLGLPCRVVPEPQAEDLSGVEAVVLGGPNPWSRLADWRLGGHRFTAIVVAGPDLEPPERRASLEPLVILRDGLAALPEALAAMTAREHQRRLVVPRGTVDLDRRTLHAGPATVSLTQREVDLLAYLASRPGRDIGRDELQREVWGHRIATSGRAVDMAVARLRKKIELTPSDPACLQTCRGGGYRLAPTFERGAHNLTPPLTRFVGREALIDRVDEALDQGPIVVLTGPAGVGKTRLATEVAFRSMTRFRGGVWRTDLEGCASAEDIVHALAGALGLRGARRGDPDATLALVRDRLASRRTLVVLDGAEHVHAPLGAVLSAVIGPSVALVTSQRPLALSGERVVVVPPLSDHAAVALFRARATAAGATDVAPPAALLALLEGIPLAIELAAGRARALPLASLQAHLADRLPSLGTRATDRSPRHRRLGNAIGAAWDLLAPGQRRAVTRLAVVHSRFDLDTAAALLDAPDALDVLDDLVDCSFVLREPSAYRILRSVQQWIRANGAPEVLASATAAHATHFAARAVARDPAVFDAVPDLLAAWDAVAGGDDDVALGQLTVALAHGLAPTRLRTRVPALLDAALARVDRDDHPGLWAALRARQTSWTSVQHLDVIVAGFREAADAARRAGDAATHAHVLDLLSRNLPYRDREPIYRELATLGEGVPAVLARASLVMMDQIVHWRGDPDAPAHLAALRTRLIGRPHATGAVAEIGLMELVVLDGLGRRADRVALGRELLGLPGLNRPHRARILVNLGWDRAMTGDLPGALLLFDEVDRLMRAARPGDGFPWTAWYRGAALLDAGRHEAAEAHLGRLQVVGRRPGPGTPEAEALLALLRLDQGRATQAAVLAADGLVDDDPAHRKSATLCRIVTAIAALEAGDPATARGVVAEGRWVPCAREATARRVLAVLCDPDAGHDDLAALAPGLPTAELDGLFEPETTMTTALGRVLHRAVWARPGLALRGTA